METWQALLLVVTALLVGAAIPALVLFATALRAIRVGVDRVGERADAAFAAATSVAGRVDRVIDQLEKGDRLGAALDGLASLSRTLNQLQETARVASAVGAAVAPAVGAAVRAWREHRDGGAGPDDDARADLGSAAEEREEPS